MGSQDGDLGGLVFQATQPCDEWLTRRTMASDEENEIHRRLVDSKACHNIPFAWHLDTDCQSCLVHVPNINCFDDVFAQQLHFWKYVHVSMHNMYQRVAWYFATSIHLLNQPCATE